MYKESEDHWKKKESLSVHCVHNHGSVEVSLYLYMQLALQTSKPGNQVWRICEKKFGPSPLPPLFPFHTHLAS